MKKIMFFLDKKNPISGYSRSNQMPSTDQITAFAPYVRTVFWATIYYKYHNLVRERKSVVAAERQETASKFNGKRHFSDKYRNRLIKSIPDVSMKKKLSARIKKNNLNYTNSLSKSTVCLRSLNPSCNVTYYMKWIKTSKT